MLCHDGISENISPVSQKPFCTVGSECQLKVGIACCDANHMKPTFTSYVGAQRSDRWLFHYLVLNLKIAQLSFNLRLQILRVLS